MAFQSLHHILDALEKQPGWQQQRQWRSIVTHWEQAVGEMVAKHAWPYSLSGQTLWVNTSSSVWAQELTYKKVLILPRLNQLIDQPLEELKFRFGSRTHSSGKSTYLKDSQHPSVFTGQETILCPQCQCPTPPKELDRWSCCALCASKKWSQR